MIDPNQLPDHEPEKHEEEEQEQNAAPASDDDLNPSGITEEPDGSDDDPVQAKIEVLEAELDQTKDQLLRTAAELENTRRRAQKERADASKFGIAGFARDMLAVADNLSRALEAVPEDLKAADPRMEGLIDGIQATQRELMRNLEKNDVKALNPEGEVFNPNFHEVMFETPGTGQPAGTVIQVLEVGYMIGDRLLRPARVGVAKDDGQGGGGQGGAPSTDPGAQIDTEA